MLRQQHQLCTEPAETKPGRRGGAPSCNWPKGAAVAGPRRALAAAANSESCIVNAIPAAAAPKAPFPAASTQAPRKASKSLSHPLPPQQDAGEDKAGKKAKMLARATEACTRRGCEGSKAGRQGRRGQLTGSSSAFSLFPFWWCHLLFCLAGVFI